MRIRFLSGLVMCLQIILAAAHDKETHRLLNMLDQTIQSREKFTNIRQSKIDSLNKLIITVDDSAEKYNLYREIYGAYHSFRNDSALITASNRLNLARGVGDKSKITSASLNLAESYTASGNYHEALEILDTISRQNMASHHLRYLYSIYSRIYKRMGKNDAIDSRKVMFKNKEKAYRDSSQRTFSDQEAVYHYLKAWQLMDAGHWKEALYVMEQTENKFGSNENDASLLGQKALIYHHLGDAEKEKQLLAKSSILDLEGGSKDYSSLIDLAIHLNEEGDHERAYFYIRTALDDAMFCNAKSRTTEILQSVPVIDAGYTQSVHDRRKMIIVFLAVVTIMAAGLFFALLVVRRQLRHNKLIRNQLEQSGETKSGYINELFDDYSNYIERISKYRKHILMLLKVGKYGEAKTYVESDKLEANELKELYAKFDKIFLSIHPLFIAEFNRMVKPEARYTENPTTLSSSLRVVAMMKLGVTSTKNIASLLHYNQQTVYNYRNKIKSSLIVDKAVFDDWLGVKENGFAE